jgi:AraC-like DNA-binding protein
MAPNGPAATRGILNPTRGEQNFKLSRVVPSPDVRHFIDWYWIVTWDLREGESYRAETLPFPSVHIALEERRPEIHGVVTQKFSRRLRGRGRVFGIKFRPAMFHPFVDTPLSSFTDRVVSIRSVFGDDGMELRRGILDEPDGERCAGLAEKFLKERLPDVTSIVGEIRDLVERIVHERGVTRVEQLAALVGIGPRPLQRSFNKYVGVSPKWVIRRYRLQEAAEALARGDLDNMRDLALRLGYFDQAHFIRDFKAVVGKTPQAYAKGTAA